ncbi:MAG: hypothetical protein KBA06_00230 [Saprospiraceae bacterium]|nr:hypothetical protein [Saprospiraceae bacterium]
MNSKYAISFLVCVLAISIFSSCSPDKIISDRFGGKYSIQPDFTSLDSIMKSKNVEIKEAIDKSKLEIKGNSEEAATEFEKAIDEINIDGEVTIDGKKVNIKDLKNNLKEGIGGLFKKDENGKNFFDGIQQILEGVGTASDGLGKLGVNGFEALFNTMNVSCDFKSDGSVELSSSQIGNVNFDSSNLTWKIINKQLHIFDEDKSKPKFVFDIQPQGITSEDWILSNESMKLKLKKIK